jgi:hypothetical protein
MNWSKKLAPYVTMLVESLDRSSDTERQAVAMLPKMQSSGSGILERHDSL